MTNHEHMKNTVVILFLVLCLCILILSCSEDCPSCPDLKKGKTYHGYLYVADFNGKIYQIDTETDSLIDSTYNLGRATYFGVSQDGRYLGAADLNSTPGHTVIFDAQTLDPIIHLDSLVICTFISSENLMIGRGARGMIYYYGLPDFGLLESDSVGVFRGPILDEEHGLIYNLGVNTNVRMDSMFFIAYDYLNREIADIWLIEDAQGQSYSIFNFDMSISDQDMYFVGNDRAALEMCIYSYNLTHETINWKFGVEHPGGEVALSPDGVELYYVAPSSGGMYVESGAIYIIDAVTGRIRHTISTYGYKDRASFHLSPWHLAVTPTGDKLYVGAGGNSMGHSSVIVVDLATREIVKFIWPDLDHTCGPMVIGPKL